MTIPVLETARLRLRPVTPADAPTIVEGVGDWDVAKWLAVVPHPYTADDAREFIEVIAPRAEGLWAIDDGGLAGIISVEGEIGYWLARDRWGRGYATEAGRAVVDWHFGRGARVLPSGFFDGNERSGAVLAKLGFQPAGDRVKGCLARGEDLLSHRVMLTREGWRAGQSGLSFRPLGAGELAALTAIVSDWGVVRNLGSWPWPPEPEFTASRTKAYAGEGFVWAIVRDGAMVGTVSVTGPEAELGYMLRPDLHGHGIGGLAARVAVAHAFATRDMAQVKADIWADNVASARLLARMGFVRVVQEQVMSKARGVMTASETWVLARGDWESLEDRAKTG